MRVDRARLVGGGRRSGEKGRGRQVGERVASDAYGATLSTKWDFRVNSDGTGVLGERPVDWQSSTRFF